MMDTLKFPELPRLVADECTGMAGIVFNQSESPLPRPIGVVTVKIHGVKYACLVYPDLTALAWLAHPSIDEWLAIEVPKRPKSAKLKVWWWGENCEGGDIVAAEVDRLGLPRSKRVKRW
jgi:hypothetical protein